ncbi:MAG: adenylyl-sulfate kinase, partial [Candidatus Aminicenantes bacterium]|nr:adenylyl-sulfate kinase [Candidatus Aminicenantes bacterium]
MAEQKATNLVWHEHLVNREDRAELLNQQGTLLWFTGLSASGKSTIANEVAFRLFKSG